MLCQISRSRSLALCVVLVLIKTCHSQNGCNIMYGFCQACDSLEDCEAKGVNQCVQAINDVCEDWSQNSEYHNITVEFAVFSGVEKKLRNTCTDKIGQLNLCVDCSDGPIIELVACEEYNATQFFIARNVSGLTSLGNLRCASTAVIYADFSSSGISDLGCGEENSKAVARMWELRLDSVNINFVSAAFTGMTLYRFRVRNAVIPVIESRAFSGGMIMDTLDLSGSEIGMIASEAFTGLEYVGAFLANVRLFNFSYTVFGNDTVSSGIQMNAFTGLSLNIFYGNGSILRAPDGILASSFSGLVVTEFFLNHAEVPGGIQPFAFTALTVGNNFDMSYTIIGTIFAAYAFWFLNVGNNLVLHHMSFPKNEIQPSVFGGLIMGCAFAASSFVLPIKFTSRNCSSVIDLSYCNIEALVSLDCSSLNNTCRAQSQEFGFTGPFAGLIVQAGFPNSMLNLSHNKLTVMNEYSLEGAAVRTIDLSYNQIDEYHAGWAGVIMEMEGVLLTDGNPSVCRTSSEKGDGFDEMQATNIGLYGNQIRIDCTCVDKDGITGITVPYVGQNHSQVNETHSYCSNSPCLSSQLVAIQARIDQPGRFYADDGTSFGVGDAVVTISSGSILQYKCIPGYVAHGKTDLTCMGGNFRTTNLPWCHEKWSTPWWVYFLALVLPLVVVINGWILKNLLLHGKWSKHGPDHTYVVNILFTGFLPNQIKPDPVQKSKFESQIVKEVEKRFEGMGVALKEADYDVKIDMEKLNTKTPTVIVHFRSYSDPVIASFRQDKVSLIGALDMLSIENFVCTLQQEQMQVEIEEELFTSSGFITHHKAGGWTLMGFFFECFVALTSFLPGANIFLADKFGYSNKVAETKAAMDIEAGLQRQERGWMAHKIETTERNWKIAWSCVEPMELIGEGAFGVVHLAVWDGTTKVALKLLKPGALVDSESEDFQKEARIMQSLSHPNIVRFYGAGTKPADETSAVTPFLVTEIFYDGTLRDLLEQHHQEFDWEQRRKFCADVAAAITYLHSRDPCMMHRDLKAENCLAYRDNAGFGLKVGDFGTVANQHTDVTQRKLTNSTLTPRPKKGRRTSSAIHKNRSKTTMQGTPMWMAPEVMVGKHGSSQYGLPCDVYSFGIVMYEIGTGVLPQHQPLTNDNDDASPEIVVDTKETLWVYKLSEWLAQGYRPKVSEPLPPDYARLMKQCWATKPNERPKFKDTVAGNAQLHAMVQNMTLPV
eukprot:m.141097 g.141097  ORF g.141097 m.141097 type:complete len:1220 (-) comp30162_c0_seq2:53-3712(-)